MKNEMCMTEKLANALLGDLACLVISAIGGDPFDEETVVIAEKYARETFCNLCEALAKKYNKTWFVLVEDEDEEQN